MDYGTPFCLREHGVDKEVEVALVADDGMAQLAVHGVIEGAEGVDYLVGSDGYGVVESVVCFGQRVGNETATAGEEAEEDGG